MRIISLEEHFSIPEMSARIDKKLVAARGWPPGHQDRFALQLADTGEQRLASMDEADITMQILSVAVPGAHLFPTRSRSPFALGCNDDVGPLIETNPLRLSGFDRQPMVGREDPADGVR